MNSISLPSSSVSITHEQDVFTQDLSSPSPEDGSTVNRVFGENIRVSPPTSSHPLRCVSMQRSSLVCWIISLRPAAELLVRRPVAGSR